MHICADGILTKKIIRSILKLRFPTVIYLASIPKKCRVGAHEVDNIGDNHVPSALMPLFCSVEKFSIHR
jgi:hypothetical protein